MSELQDAFKDVDDLADGSEPDTFWAIVKAARLVAAAPKNPEPPDEMSINEKQAWKEGWFGGWLAQAALSPPGDTE